jgi:hypothetical protein
MLDDLFALPSTAFWPELARQIGGAYTPGSLLQFGSLRLQHHQWTILLDIWKQGKSYNTRMRARFLNRNGFWFTVYPQGAISTARKWLGIQDIVVGHASFDDEFIIQGNDKSNLKQLFDNQRLRFLLQSLGAVHFSIADQDHSYWGVPEGVHELCLTTREHPGQMATFQQLFELFTETLDELRRLGTIAQDDPGVAI